MTTKKKQARTGGKRAAKRKEHAQHVEALRDRLDATVGPSAAVKTVPNESGIGRPTKEVDERILSGLAAIQCTYAEMSAVIGVDESTLRRTYAALIEKERESGKMSLRRAQFSNALKGNTVMQIWLGKQYLGQKDKHEIAGEDGAIPMLVIRREDATTDDLSAGVRAALDGTLTTPLEQSFTRPVVVP